MSEHGGKTYRPWEPERYQHGAYSPAAKLSEGDLVFFLLETVPRLDLSRFYAPDEKETRGAPPYDPAMMSCLLIYAYCVGVFSSRKIALACERNLAFIAIVGDERPDFRTISDFRKDHLEAFMELFVQVLRLAKEAGLVKLGNVSIDGSKIQGNASRHKAMSYGYMQKEVERLREEIESLVTQAFQQDEAEEAALGSRRGDELPKELERREQRLAVMEAAMQRLEAQAKAEAEAERARRAEADTERARQGKKRRGREPKAVEETPPDKAQMSFTDAELHIMPTNHKGWDYCGNAQASTDGAYQVILACDVTDAPNDKQQAEPMAQATLANLDQAGIERPKNDSGQEQAIPATLDNGYYSEAAAQALEDLGFDPYIAAGRHKHHEPEAEVSAEAATAKERMAAKVRTPEGKALYSRRKVMVEPVFGQVKEDRGFRRFLLRGLKKIRGEWSLVCMTHNLLKIWRYGWARQTA
jgi:transposase